MFWIVLADLGNDGMAASIVFSFYFVGKMPFKFGSESKSLVSAARRGILYKPSLHLWLRSIASLETFFCVLQTTDLNSVFEKQRRVVCVGVLSHADQRGRRYFQGDMNFLRRGLQVVFSACYLCCFGEAAISAGEKKCWKYFPFGRADLLTVSRWTLFRSPRPLTEQFRTPFHLSLPG